MNELIRNIHNIPLNTIVNLPIDRQNSVQVSVQDSVQVSVAETVSNIEIADAMSRDFTTGAVEAFSPLAQDNSLLGSFAEQTESINALLSLNPMIVLELAAITFTLLYLVQLTLPRFKLSLISFKNFTDYFTEDVLEYVNVGNLISWPKRSLNNQRVFR